jgi:hypothetical protein
MVVMCYQNVVRTFEEMADQVFVLFEELCGLFENILFFYYEENQ